MTFDIQFFYLLNNLAGQSLFLDNVIVFLASYLAYMLVTVFLILIFFSHYQKREKWEIFLVTVISSIVARFGITELIRFFYHRPRPFSMLEAHQLLSNGEWSSRFIPLAGLSRRRLKKPQFQPIDRNMSIC